MALLLAMYIVIGLLSIVLAVPLIYRRVKPNPWYGFRVRATLEDEEVWYEVNVYTGWALLEMGFAVLAAAVILYLVPGMNKDTYALGCLGALMVSAAVGFGLAARRLLQLTKRRR